MLSRVLSWSRAVRPLLRGSVACVLLVVFALLALNIHSAQAQSPDEEAIRSFDAALQVNTDNSADITETIDYQTGSRARHGIYRDIYPYSSQGRDMSLTDISVTDTDGNPYAFTTSWSGADVRIKIGDADHTFTGEKTYVIKYHATSAVGQTDTFDEIYWNVTGNEWLIPIYSVRETVKLPEGAKAIQTACYYGPQGSTTQCPGPVAQDAYVFSNDSMLSPGDGYTVAVGFPKGIVTQYSAAQNFFDRYGRWLLAALLPLLTFIVCFWYWYAKGRDDRKTGTIIPYYDVDNGLTPMEAAGIALERINPSHISAEIIYLATRGYLKIVQIEEQLFGLVTHPAYELVELVSDRAALNATDALLMDSMFKSGATVNPAGQKTVRLSSLKNRFYAAAKKVIQQTGATLLAEGYYKHLGRLKNPNAPTISAYIFFAIWISGLCGGFVGAIVNNTVLGVVVIFASLAIIAIFNYLSPAKTDKGVTAKEHLLGLREYLQIAEKDRLEFHNAPERKAEVFEKLLPYAMALGVAQVWAKEFEDIYTVPPNWYQGSNPGIFNAVIFSNTLSSFSTTAASTFSSSPRSSGSSGSGGGGSSGGGGGGGGGGGW